MKRNLTILLMIVLVLALSNCAPAPTAAPTEAPPVAPAETEAPPAPAETEAPVVTEAPAATEEPAATESPAEGGEVDDGTFTVAMYTDFTDWDPAAAFSLEIWFLRSVYETLLWYNVPGSEETFSPGLATSWEVSEDGLSWTFHLREGVKFHDGTDMNAEAVKYSIERTKELGMGGAYIWSPLDYIEAVDDYTAVFHLKYPAPIDLIASSQYSSYIYSPAAGEKGTEWFQEGHDGGTGPYMIDSWEPDQQTVLVKFPEYWAGWEGEHFSKVILKVVLEKSTQVQMLESGEADRATSVPVDSLESLMANPEISVITGPSWMNSQFLINVMRPPTDNLLIRQAISYAWDYQTVVDKIYNGMAEIAQGPIPKTMWGHKADMELYSFDLEKAKALVEESGLSPEELKIVLAYHSTSSEYENAALLLQQDLAEIGIEVELKPGPWNTLWEECKNLDTAPNIMTMTWWPTYPTPNDWLYGQYRTEDPTNFNLSHYSNPEMDAMLDEAMALEGTDRDEAIRLYGEIQQLLVHDAPAVFYADIMFRITQRANIHGEKPNPAYNAPNFYLVYRTD